MKSIFGVSAFILYCLPMFAQEKLDYTWVLGYPPNDTSKGYGGTMLNFNSGNLTFTYFNTPTFIDNSSQICDTSGNLLLYSNGCKIINFDHEILPNSDNLSPGAYHDEWCDPKYNDSYLTHQGSVLVPWPDRPGQYVLFHLGWYRMPKSPYTSYLQDFYYTHIDMNANGGQGLVLEKNQQLLYDTNLVDNVTAVRHGNGRDWWLVLPRGRSNTLYTFLLDPQGVHGPFEQQVGAPMERRGWMAGQVVFSPDGNTYVRSNFYDGINILHFDRCKGVFSCPLRLPFPSPGVEFAPSGVAVSPNSRHLYVTTGLELYQYDLWTPDIEHTKILIDEYDGFKGPYHATTFYQQMLAPDGKIYMTATNGVQYMHIIHQPDQPGTACDFRQHDLKLPGHIGFCVPNFPYFRLYDAPGSPCDTLGINAPEGYRAPWASDAPSESVHIRPNPASDQFTLAFPPCQGGVLRVFNMAGQQVEILPVDRQIEHQFDCSAWPAGLYVLSFFPEAACKPFSFKLAVAR